MAIAVKYIKLSRGKEALMTSEIPMQRSNLLSHQVNWELVTCVNSY